LDNHLSRLHVAVQLKPSPRNRRADVYVSPRCCSE